jgi:hypothetical protein
MEARPLICTKLTVKTHDGRQLISGLVNCAATLDFVLEDFVRRFALKTRKSPTKIHVRLTNGQRVTSSIVCDITFELARHEFQRNFYVPRDLRAADLVLGLPCACLFAIWHYTCFYTNGWRDSSGDAN